MNHDNYSYENQRQFTPNTSTTYLNHTNVSIKSNINQKIEKLAKINNDNDSYKKQPRFITNPLYLNDTNVSIKTKKNKKLEKIVKINDENQL